MKYQTLELKALNLKAKDQAYTLFSGNHLSKLQGEGYDFSSLREYQMGDDIRKIHWMSTAKMGKPYIKELHANRALSVSVCALLDASMYFGKGNDKQKKVTEVATMIAYLATLNSDIFTGIAYTQDNIIQSPTSKEHYHIEAFSKALYECQLLGTKIDIQASIKELFIHLQKPSLIFIIYDFLEDIDLSLLSQKHEIIAIIIRDRAEEFPKPLGEITLQNPSSSKKAESYWNKKTKKHYLKNLRIHEEKLQNHFNRYNIRSLRIFTDEDILQRFLEELL
jgi:uncharacterized protein (DUF58 family)